LVKIKLKLFEEEKSNFKKNKKNKNYSIKINKYIIGMNDDIVSGSL
jgi:hypothetical protein